SELVAETLGVETELRHAHALGQRLARELAGDLDAEAVVTEEDVADTGDEHETLCTVRAVARWRDRKAVQHARLDRHTRAGCRLRTCPSSIRTPSRERALPPKRSRRARRRSSARAVSRRSRSPRWSTRGRSSCSFRARTAAGKRRSARSSRRWK